MLSWIAVAPAGVAGVSVRTTFGNSSRVACVLLKSFCVNEQLRVATRRSMAMLCIIVCSCARSSRLMPSKSP